MAVKSIVIPFWFIECIHSIPTAEESTNQLYSIWDSQGSNFNIIFIHISLSTEDKTIKLYISLKEMTQGVFLL